MPADSTKIQPENPRDQARNNREPVLFGVLTDKVTPKMVLTLVRDVLALQNLVNSQQVLRIISPMAVQIQKAFPPGFDIEFQTSDSPECEISRVYWTDKKPPLPDSLKPLDYMYLGEDGPRKELEINFDDTTRALPTVPVVLRPMGNTPNTMTTPPHRRADPNNIPFFLMGSEGQEPKK